MGVRGTEDPGVTNTFCPSTWNITFDYILSFGTALLKTTLNSNFLALKASEILTWVELSAICQARSAN